MKLTNDQVETISLLILTGLKEQGLVVFKTDEDTVLRRVVLAITQDLRAEDQLDREVEGMLESHSTSINDGSIDHRKMFNMIKRKLVKERGLII